MKNYYLLILIFCNFLSVNAQTAIVTVDFNTMFKINGNASIIATDKVQLTPNLTGQSGSAFSKIQVDFAYDFSLTQTMYFGNNDAGADGMGFTIHNDPRKENTIGGAGGSIGLEGIANSICYKFDTYVNSPEPNCDFVVFGYGTGPTYGSTTCLSNIEDNLNHTFVINWVAATKVLTLTVDGTLRDTQILSNIASLLGGTTRAYFGFTGATGGSTNTQQTQVSIISGNFPPILNLDLNGSTKSLASNDYFSQGIINTDLNICDTDTQALSFTNFGIGQRISAKITIPNVLASESFTIGTLPGGVTVSNTNVSGNQVLLLSNIASLADVVTALRAVTYKITSSADLASLNYQRSLTVSLTDNFGASDSKNSTYDFQSPGGVSDVALWLKADAGTQDVVYKNVASGSRTASSNFSGLTPDNSTLASTTSWSAATAVTGEYLTLDLGSSQSVSGLSTKGRGNLAQWVTKYTVSYSNDNVTYTPVGVVFNANSDQNTEVFNFFPVAITARYFRIIETAFSGHPSLRADLITTATNTTNGASLTVWADQSSKLNTVSQSIIANKPTFSSSSTDLVNFNPTIKFNGSNQVLTNPLGVFKANTFSAASMFIMTKTNVVQNNNLILTENLGTGTSTNFYAPYGDSNVYWDGANNSRINTLWGGTVGIPYLWTGFNNQAATPTNRKEIRRDGLVLTSNATAPASYTGNNSPMSIGSTYNGNINEVIIYNTELTALQRQRIESYLAIKYGKTLDQTVATNYLASDGSTIVWNATTNSGYNNAIFGLGRDDGSSLHQRISTSVNTGELVIISSNSDFTTSNTTANHTDIANDKYFLIAGNNGLTTQYNSFTSTNTSVNSRMNRIWKVQETGTDQGVINIKTSDATATYIVVSPDATFGDANDVYTALTSGTAALNLANGQYFTFATFLNFPGGISNGIAVWYKANSISSATADNAAVASITDSSGQLMTGTTFNSPTYRTGSSAVGLNFNPVLSFNGTNQYIQAPSGFANFTAGMSMFSAHQFTNTNLFARIMDFGIGQANNNLIFSRQGTTTSYASVVLNGTTVPASQLTTANTVYTNSYGMLSWVIPGGTAGVSVTGSVNLKGVTNISGTYLVPQNVTRTTNYLGRSNWNESYFAGYVPEYILYNKALTAPEQLQVNSYLALKYGFTLGTTAAPLDYKLSDGTTVWTANATYQYNVIGIGKDNLSALEQQISKSSETNADVITISSDNNFVNSNGTHSAITNDKYFLVTGNNGATADYTIFASTNSAVNSRMNRIWKVQETGTDQGVINIKTSDANATYIVVSSDATFGDANDVYTALTSGATALNLANGQYFTFGTFIISPGAVLSPDFWVKSDDAGTIATAWKDNSLNANPIENVGSLTLSTANAAHNFYPYTTGYSSTKYFRESVSSFAPTAAYIQRSMSVFSSVRPTSLAAGRIVGIDNDNLFAAEPSLSLNATGQTHFYKYSGTTQAYDSTLAATVNQSTLSYWLANDTTKNILVGLNGNENSTTVAVGQTFGTWGPYMMLGYGTWDNAGAFSGDIMEVAWYNRVLTTNESDRVNSYMGIKNGVTFAKNYLSSNSSIIWDRTTNASFNNNIAGIGYDINSGLQQKQANSVNASQQVIIGNGSTLFNDNASNTNSFSIDNSFMLWGDNGLAKVANVSISGISGINGRFASIWKVQETGTVGTVVVAWPVGLTNLKLIRSTDGIFDNTDTVISMTSTATINGVTYNTATVDFNNGDYFTFGAYVIAPGGILNSIAVWYKANSISNATADNTTISSITDSSGNAMTGTTFNSPTYRRGNSTVGLNFNPVLSFNGTNQYIQAPSGFANFTAGISMFSAHQFTNTNSWARIMDFGNGAPSDNLIFSRNATNNYYGLQVYNAVSQTLINSTANSVYTNSYGLVNWNQAAGVAGTNVSSSLYLKGMNNLTGSLVVPNNVVRTINYIGRSNWGADAYFAGYVPEFILYNRSLTAPEQLQVNSYLALKYGFTLGTTVAPLDYKLSDGTTVWTANATYQYNVIGIGKDSLSGLEQQISKSSETVSDIITISTDNNYTNSNSSHSAIANDKYFLIVGNNNASTNFTTYSGGSNATTIMSRIWKTQKTGTDQGNVYIKANTNKAQFLVISNDATFTDSDTWIQMSFGMAAVNFSNGQYFTFASNVIGPGGVASNLSLWNQGDSGVSYSGTNVTAWVDQTATNTFTINGSPQFNSLGINFNPSVGLNGSSYFTGNTSITNFTDCFSVAKIQNPSGLSVSGAVLGTTAVVGGNYFFHTEVGTLYFGSPFAGTNAFGNNINWSIMNGDLSETPAATQKIKINGIEYANSVGGDSVLHSGIPQIGARGSEGLLSGSEIAEVILYNSSKGTGTERSRIQSYLAVKYGLTLGNNANPVTYLASDASTIWTGSTTYQNNIIGLARDNTSGLEQQISFSQSTSADVLTLSTDNDFTLADGFHTPVDVNKSFLMLGNNNGSTATTTAGVPSGYTKRVARQWLVQNTSFSQNVYLQFSGYGSISGRTWYVIKRNGSSDLSTGITQVVALDTTGKTDSAISLLTGDYFTLASIETNTDGDVYGDLDDLDDDNDGILDAMESATCFMTANEWNTTDKSNQVTITSDFSMASGLNNFSNLTDNINTTDAVQFTTTIAQDELNKSIFKFQFLNPIQLTNIYITKASATQIFAANVQLQGSNDGITWTNLNTAAIPANTASGTVTNGSVAITNYNILTVSTNAAAYSYYRIYGTATGNVLTGIAREIYFDATTTAYISSSFPKSTCSENVDSANDSLYNHQDLDSDNDGCFDSIEGGLAFNLFNGQVAANGRLTGAVSSVPATLGVPVLAGTGQPIGSSQNATVQDVDCGRTLVDFDTDGKYDFEDVDDDNDGIYDAIESTTCFVSINEWNITAKYNQVTITSDLIQVAGLNNLVNLADNVNSVDAVQFNTTTAQSQNGKAIFQFRFLSPIQLSTIYIQKNSATQIFSANVQLQGSNDGTAWTNLNTAGIPVNTASGTVTNGSVAITNYNLLSVTTGAAAYRFYRIYGVAAGNVLAGVVREIYFDVNTGVGLYNPSYFTKSTCSVNTDGDALLNHQDLDSDNDGCSDANEAYTSLTAQGSDGNMYYGTGNPPAINANGSVIGASYANPNGSYITIGSASTISTQPSDQSTTVGGNVTFTVTATGGSGTRQYQWQVSTDGTTWNNVTNGGVYSGTTTTTLTITGATATMSGYLYKTVITQSDYICGNVVTSSAKLCVVDAPTVGTITQPTCAVVTGSVILSGLPSTGTWTINPGGITGTGTSTTISNLAEGTYNFTVTNASDCTSSASTDVVINSIVYTVAGTVSSAQTICSGTTPSDLTLTGNTGSVVKWQKATDAIFTTPVDIASTSTTLTGTIIGSLTTTTYFRAVVQNGSCAVAYTDPIEIFLKSTTWDGTAWSNGTPDISTTVFMTGNYTSSGDLFACSLTVSNNAVVNIQSGHDVTLYGKLTVDTGSTFNMANNSNLLQQTNVSNTGIINISRNTLPIFRLDYNLWSSPVTGSQTLVNFSPLTSNVSPSNIRFYTFNTTTSYFDSVATASTTTFAPAKGYLIRMPNNWMPCPITAPVDGDYATGQSWTGTFTGTPRNGDVSFTMANGGGDYSYNATGNPYPSSLSVDSFIDGNSTAIEGTLWFWRKLNNTLNPISYSTLTKAGMTLNNNALYTDEDYVSAGQGFFVKALSGQTNLSYTNAMRSSANANQFLRSNSQKDRFWLKLTNSSNVSFGTNLIAYLPNTTMGYDNGYDGLFIHDSQTSIYTVIENKDLVIQARSSFSDSDVFPLCFKTNTANTYTITLHQVEGVFETNQTVYLRDNLTGVVHNLTNGAYTFASEVGTFATRFDILYQNSLSNNQPEFSENNVIVYKNGNFIHINTGNKTMNKVRVFDIRGRLIIEKDKVNSMELSIDSSTIPNQVLLVQITSDEGVVVTKKVIN